MADFMMVHAHLGGSEIMLNQDYVVSARRIKDNNTKQAFTSLELHNGRTLDITEDLGPLALGQPRRP